MPAKLRCCEFDGLHCTSLLLLAEEAAARDGNHFDETIDVFPLARLQNWSACYSSKLVQAPLRQRKLADRNVVFNGRKQYLRAPLVGLLQVPCLSPSVTNMNRCMSTLRITLLHSGAIFNGRKRSQTSCHLEQLRRRPSRTAVQMPAVGDKRVQERH